MQQQNSADSGIAGADPRSPAESILLNAADIIDTMLPRANPNYLTAAERAQVLRVSRMLGAWTRTAD